MVHQYCLISFNKCTTPKQDDNNKGNGGQCGSKGGLNFLFKFSETQTFSEDKSVNLGSSYEWHLWQNNI